MQSSSKRRWYFANRGSKYQNDCSMEESDGSQSGRRNFPLSADNSPLCVTRRPLRVFGCANSPSRPVIFGDCDDGESAMNLERRSYSPRNSVTCEPGTSSPIKKRDRDSGTRRWSVWQNLKQKTQAAFRSKSRERGYENHMCQSNPDLRIATPKTLRRQFDEGPLISDSEMTAGNVFGKQERSMDQADISVVQSPYVSFMVKIRLKDGKDLVIRDASGSSDPYVKFKYKDRLYYKSNTIFKNLNPIWDEEFSQLIDDPTTPIRLDVFDYDRFMIDDYMGGADIDLSQQKLFQSVDLRLELHEDSKMDEYMGYVNVTVTVCPQTQKEKDEFLQRSVRGIVSELPQKRPQKAIQVWTSVVNIVLVEAKRLLPPAINSSSFAMPDPFVKFKLGNEKYKSKPAMQTLDPKWLEQFDLHIFDEAQQTLEIMVHDKRNNFPMGRCSLNLAGIQREITHQLSLNLDEGAGSILLLLSISGTTYTDTVVDLHEFTGNDVRNSIVDKYSLLHSFTHMRDIGQLTVKVFRAIGIAAADINGKSDPFVVLELVNARLQTHTEYKTLNPEWNKLFTFQVKDIHSVLEITVYDEDPNKKVEFLGRVTVPLLQIRNCERRWYALKNSKLNGRAKGQILLEMDVIWNSLKAAIQTFNPRESKYIEKAKKFKRQALINNVNRSKAFLLYAIEMKNFVQSCFNWESPIRSVVAFAVFVLLVYNIQLYHVPLFLLIIFLKNYVVKRVADTMEIKLSNRSIDDMRYFESEDEDELEDRPHNNPISSRRRPKPSSDRSSLRDRLAAVSETLATVQNVLDFITSLLERIRNTFNFTQPYLSCLAVCVLCIATALFYFVPFRWIIMAWGINKFTKKLRKPHSIPNNELLDFLSRVPCDRELREYCEYRPDPIDSAEAREFFHRQKKGRSC